MRIISVKLFEFRPVVQEKLFKDVSCLQATALVVLWSDSGAVQFVQFW